MLFHLKNDAGNVSHLVKVFLKCGKTNLSAMLLKDHCSTLIVY